MNTRPPGANHYSPVFSTRPPLTFNHQSSYPSSPRQQPEHAFSRSNSYPSTLRHVGTNFEATLPPPPPPPPDTFNQTPPPQSYDSLRNNAQKPSRPPFQKLHVAVAQSQRKAQENLVPVNQNVNEDANNQNEAIPASLMQPLYCKICAVKLNAPTQAKQHYDGKNHAKKLKQFMETAKTALKVELNQNGECSKQVQSESIQLQKPISPTSTNQTVEINPEVYCRICEASFNSPKQAEQHYQGKNHAKRLRASQSTSPPVMPEATPTPPTPPSTTTNNTSPPPASANIKAPPKFVCFICNINVTSQEQLDAHLLGVKHLTKVKMQERSQSALKGRWTSGGEPPVCASTIQNSLARGIRPLNQAGGSPFSTSPPAIKKRRRDFSMFRTPSGKYYCSCCNVTLQTEGQFAQHVDSKKHKSSNSSRKFFDNNNTDTA